MRLTTTPRQGGRTRRRAPQTAGPRPRRIPATAFSPPSSPGRRAGVAGYADDDRSKDVQITELRAAVKQLHGHLQTVLATAQTTIDTVVHEQEEQAQEAAALRATLSSVMAKKGGSGEAVPAMLDSQLAATYSSIMSDATAAGASYADWALDATFRGGLRVDIDPTTTTTLQPNGAGPRQKCGVYLTSGSRALVASSTGSQGCYIFRAASGGALLLESDQMTELFPNDILSFSDDPQAGYRVIVKRNHAVVERAPAARSSTATKEATSAPQTPTRSGATARAEEDFEQEATATQTWRSVTARDRTTARSEENQYGLDVAKRVLRQLIGRNAHGRTMTADDVFRRMDTAGRNLVTRRQFFKGLSSLAIFLNLRDQGALWRVLDINFDNRLQYTEFALLFSPSELREEVESQSTGIIHEGSPSRFKIPEKDNVNAMETLIEVARQIRSVAYVEGGLDLAGLFHRMHFHTGEEHHTVLAASEDADAVAASSRLNFHQFRSAAWHVLHTHGRLAEDEMYRAFRAMDKDNDGFITLPDLRVFVESFTPLTAGGQSQLSMNGKLPRKQWSPKKALPKKPTSFASPGHEVAYRVLAQLYHMHVTDADLFRRCDTDGSGDLTKLELVRGLESVGIYLSAVDEVNLYDALDPYDEKKLSFAAFKLMYEPAQLATTAGHGSMPPLLKSRAEAIQLGEESMIIIARKIRAAAFVEGGASIQALFAELTHKIFAELNVHQGGELNWNQFRSGMRRVARITKKTVSDDELAATFLLLDQDANGTIDMDEFESFIEEKSASVMWAHGVKLSPQKYMRESSLRHPPRPTNFVSEAHGVAWRVTAALHKRAIAPEDFFHRADTDRSGTLTRGNIIKGLEETAGVFLSDHEKTGLFSLLDRDNNHRISWVEFAVLWSQDDLIDVALGVMPPELKARARALPLRDFSAVARQLRASAYTGAGNFDGGVHLEHFFSLLGDHQHATLSWSQFQRSLRHSQVAIERMSDEILASLFLSIDIDDNGEIEFAEFEQFIEAEASKSGVHFKHAHQLHDIKPNTPIRLKKPESFSTRGSEVRFALSLSLSLARSLFMCVSFSYPLFLSSAPPHTGRVGSAPRHAAEEFVVQPSLSPDGCRRLGQPLAQRVHSRPSRHCRS